MRRPKAKRSQREQQRTRVHEKEVIFGAGSQSVRPRSPVPSDSTSSSVAQTLTAGCSVARPPFCLPLCPTLSWITARRVLRVSRSVAKEQPSSSGSTYASTARQSCTKKPQPPSTTKRPSTVAAAGGGSELAKHVVSHSTAKKNLAVHGQGRAAKEAGVVG